MSRPAPRKSSLAGSSPVTPPATAPAEPASSPAVGTHATAAPAVGTHATAAPAAEPPAAGKKKYAHKVSFYQDSEDTARVRGAILYTMTTEGNRNLSQFVNRAVMAEVERLEAKYNGGQPFPPVGAREMPQGGAAAAGF
ncbi:hypothetical protein ACFFGR_06555 [Arthrobacter liuii]|uniref:ParB family protein n=1 Tax=Arthrobacter liuii TaxID=1476996 RepID=UPI0035E6A0F0